jgi:hypothetical protein
MVAKVKHPEAGIVCDACGHSEADSEESAVAAGWVIDYAADPHTHLCLLCKEAALNRFAAGAH